MLHRAWITKELVNNDPRAVKVFVIENVVVLFCVLTICLFGFFIDFWNALPALSEMVRECASEGSPEAACGLIGLIGIAIMVFHLP
jgi:hypothetical protein